MPIDYSIIENLLYREDLSTHTIPRILGNIKRLELKKALVNKQSFETFTTAYFRNKGSRAYYNKFVQALRWYGRAFKLPWTEEFKILSEDGKVRQPFTDEEIEKFLSLPCPEKQDSLTYLKWRLFWSICAYSGCRPKEARSIETSTINLQMGVFHFQKTKIHEDRLVPISDLIKPLLEEYLPSVPGKYLFWYRNPDTFIGEQSYLKDFHWRCETLGLKNRKPYSFRHSFITRMCQDTDASLFSIQDIVGHKKADTTRRYYHGNVKAMHKAIQKDPLTRRSLTPQQSLQQLIELIRPYIEQNQHFTYSITDSSISITCRGK